MSIDDPVDFGSRHPLAAVLCDGGSRARLDGCDPWEHVVVNANSLAALRAKFPSLSAREGKPVVILSDYPQPDLLATLIGADAPMAVCADDFTTIAHLSVVSREFYGAAAARFASMALVNIEPIITAPPPLYIRWSTIREKS